MGRKYQLLMSNFYIKKICNLKIFKKLFVLETILYIFFGALTTIINWGSYILLKFYLNQTTAIANSFAWLVAVIFAYYTNKLFVFKSHQNSLKAVFREFALFIVARLMSFGFDQAFMLITVDILYFPDTIAKILSNIFVLVINFVASKIIIFKKRN